MINQVLIGKIVDYLDASMIYMGVGNGSVSEGDSHLNNELLRKPAESYIDGNTLIKELYITENEGNNILYSSAGIFDNTATGTVGTGALMAGGEISITKNNRQTITVTIEITVEGV